MANLVQSVLGKVSGRVGDLVFRQRDGKNIIAVRPASFIPGTDQASYDRRARFRLAGKLASVIDNISDLRQVWDEYSPNKSPFQNLVSVNYPYIDAAGTPGSFKLVPQTGFGTTTTLLTLSPTEVQAEINALGTNKGIDLSEEVSAKLISLVYLSDPSDINAEEYQFIVNESAEIPLQLASALVFSIPLMNQDTELFNAYQARNGYFVLVTLDADGNVIHFSNTFRNS